MAGEEDRHTLDLLLANPVSRARIVLEKAAAMVLGTFVLAAVTGAALVLEGRWADMALPVAGVAAAMLHLALLGVVFGALALAIGAAFGHAAASRAVPAVIAVVAYVVNGLAPQVSWLQPVRKLSPFYQFNGHDPLRNGVSGRGRAGRRRHDRGPGVSGRGRLPPARRGGLNPPCSIPSGRRARPVSSSLTAAAATTASARRWARSSVRPGKADLPVEAKGRQLGRSGPAAHPDVTTTMRVNGRSDQPHCHTGPHGEHVRAGPSVGPG